MSKKILKKRFVFLLLIFAIFSNAIFAQVAADPNDSFYEDALRWELQGLVPNLPEMRPYSLQLVKNVLETVMNSDNFEESSRAKQYYEQYFEKALRFGVETSVYTNIQKGDFDKQLDINPVIYGNAEVLPNTTISFEATPLLSTVPVGSEIIPKYTAPKYDSISDSLEAGPFNVYTPYNAVAAFGTDEIYFQAGLNRNAFGSILDTGIVIGATAPHVGSMVFTINKEKFNYQLGLLMLSASNSYGKGRYPSKYLFMHSLRYSFTDKFDFTIYETAVTGPRFDFVYLMPIVPFMAMQQVVGYGDDNLLMGVQLEYRPISGLKVFLNGYADDISFNDLVKLNFNTKLKMALETGLAYAPLGQNLCKLITVDYTFLAPYMYTHSMYNSEDKLDYEIPNYQNYISSGVSIGSELSPNSDRFRFNIKINPIDNLELDIFSSVVRHGNINETLLKNGVKDNTITDKYAFEAVKQYLFADGAVTDGSIQDFPDSGYIGSDIDSGYFYYVNHKFLFLENTTNYVCLQNAINAKYTLNLKNKSYFVFNLGYTLQYEKNIGVGTNIFTKSGLSNYSDNEAVITELEKQYETWKSKLYNKFSNFFNFSIKYVY